MKRLHPEDRIHGVNPIALALFMILTYAILISGLILGHNMGRVVNKDAEQNVGGAQNVKG